MENNKAATLFPKNGGKFRKGGGKFRKHGGKRAESGIKKPRLTMLSHW